MYRRPLMETHCFFKKRHKSEKISLNISLIFFGNKIVTSNTLWHLYSTQIHKSVVAKPMYCCGQWPNYMDKYVRTGITARACVLQSEKHVNNIYIFKEYPCCTDGVDDTLRDADWCGKANAFFAKTYCLARPCVISTSRCILGKQTESENASPMTFFIVNRKRT